MALLCCVVALPFEMLDGAILKLKKEHIRDCHVPSLTSLNKWHHFKHGKMIWLLTKQQQKWSVADVLVTLFSEAHAVGMIV